MILAQPSNFAVAERLTAKRWNWLNVSRRSSDGGDTVRPQVDNLSHAQDLGSAGELEGILDLLDRGNGASRQIVVWEANHDMHEVIIERPREGSHWGHRRRMRRVDPKHVAKADPESLPLRMGHKR